MMVTMTFYICVAIFSLQITLQKSHLILWMILQWALGQFTGEDTELRNDKQFAKTPMHSNNKGDFEPLMFLSETSHSGTY